MESRKALISSTENWREIVWDALSIVFHIVALLAIGANATLVWYLVLSA